MRIKVITSINVRSNTAPSTPVLPSDVIPDNWNDHRILKEKNSTPEMHSLSSTLETTHSRFLASQRPPKGSRLSAWIHGFSVMDNERRPTIAQNRKVSHITTQCYSRTPRRGSVRSQRNPTRLRPAGSTRGIIDPVHSPTSSCWPLSNSILEDPRQASLSDGPHARTRQSPEDLQSKSRHRGKRTKKVSKETSRLRLSNVTDPKIRRKIIGCLLFGTILIIVLTTYLALATSNLLRGATFHAVFIFFILLLTIIFSHYLIRLCMLTLEQSPRFGHRRKSCMQLPTDEEAGFARPSEPIRVTMVRDEAHTVHEDGVEGVEGDNDEDEEKEVPAPPPAYGLWRSSVRADPNLIHWQSIGSPGAVQSKARALILAGSGHRPPSYSSEETVNVHGQAEVLATPPAPPIPVFAQRRQAATVNYMRHQYSNPVLRGQISGGVRLDE